jgi:hypothetical protein
MGTDKASTHGMLIFGVYRIYVYDLKLRNKIGAFIEFTKTRKSVFLSMITTFWLLQNEYSRSIIHNEITMDDLFDYIS